MARQIRAVVPELLGTKAIDAMSASMQWQPCHHAIAMFEIRDGGAECDDFAAAFVRGGAGEFGGENAGGDYAVRVAERGDFDFEEKIMWR